MILRRSALAWLMHHALNARAALGVRRDDTDNPFLYFETNTRLFVLYQYGGLPFHSSTEQNAARGGRTFDECTKREEEVCTAILVDF